MTPHRWMMKAVGEPLFKQPLELRDPGAGNVLVEEEGVVPLESGFARHRGPRSGAGGAEG